MRRIEIEDILRIIRIGSMDLSLNGDLAYTVTIPDIDRNKYVGGIRILWHDGRETFYEGKDDSTPRWSPDGNYLAFIGRRDAGKDEKGSGIYIVGYAGEPRRVAWFKYGVSKVKWLDNKTLLVLADTPEKDYDEDGDYVSTEEAPIWFDRYGFVAGLKQQLYRVDVESGYVKKFTDERYGLYDFEVHKGEIYYTTIVDWSYPIRNKLVRLVDGEPHTILDDMHISSLRSIGDRLYFLGNKFEIGISSHDKLYMLYNDMPECLTCGVLDRNIWGFIGGYREAPTFIYADAGKTVIARYSGGVVEKLVDDEQMIFSGVARDDVIYFTASKPTKPMEIYRYTEEGVEQVTNLNTWLVDEVQLYPIEKMVLEAEGDKVDGWVINPGGEGEKPFILFIHGGPKGMYGYRFHPMMQLFAGRGFIVGFCNPRGSDGYTEEFADIRGKYGEEDYRQIMAFVEKVREKYPIDEAKTVVTGISYGGYMTNVVVTKTDFFKVGVSENGIADWIADYWASDIGYWFNPDQIGGDPINNLQNYIEKSPAFHVRNVKASLLIIHSMEDYRCFVDQALAMHMAMKTFKKDSKLVVFTKGSHGHSLFADPRHRRKRLEIILKWVGEKLGLKLLGKEGEGKPDT